MILCSSGTCCQFSHKQSPLQSGRIAMLAMGCCMLFVQRIIDLSVCTLVLFSGSPLHPHIQIGQILASLQSFPCILPHPCAFDTSSKQTLQLTLMQSESCSICAHSCSRCCISVSFLLSCLILPTIFDIAHDCHHYLCTCRPAICWLQMLYLWWTAWCKPVASCCLLKGQGGGIMPCTLLLPTLQVVKQQQKLCYAM